MLSTKLKEAAGNSADATLTDYVDDVFSTYLYTGNSSTQTITNGIDLAGKGGLVWTKERSSAGFLHQLYDSARGISKLLISNNTGQETTNTEMSSFNSTGYTVSGTGAVNYSGSTFVGWTFRKAAKFFDVVTYTGTGSARTIAHSLGVAPGMVIVKRTDTTSNWQVYSNGLTSAAYSIVLNDSVGQASAPTVWNSTSPTSSVFSVGTDATVNASGGTYVAYLYAHDTAADGIIQCGSYATNASYVGPNVNLGFEPAWILVKKANGNGPWSIVDTMRGWTTDGNVVILNPNSASEEGTTTQFKINATGFQDNGAFSDNATMIYMAIRRPNKPPTSGTQVFTPTKGLNASGQVFPANHIVDFLIGQDVGGNSAFFQDRLRGAPQFLEGSSGAVEATSADWRLDTNNGVNYASVRDLTTRMAWLFKRAPGFFDVVCYTGTGVARAVAHNLGVAPELILFKRRDGVGHWIMYAAPTGISKFFIFNWADAAQIGSCVDSVAPTISEFRISPYQQHNVAGGTAVAYLFATLAGISKVGSYTGNGSSQNIECGFAAGARFVLIKCTSATGDWYVWDTARGITSGNDPHLSLNTTATEVTTDDSVDPYSAGFAVNQVAATNINVASATYIFLAIS